MCCRQATKKGSVSHSNVEMALWQLQKEASEVFFSVTKLFQNKDSNLRRMVYLVIKDVCPSADEVQLAICSCLWYCDRSAMFMQHACTENVCFEHPPNALTRNHH